MTKNLSEFCSDSEFLDVLQEVEDFLGVTCEEAALSEKARKYSRNTLHYIADFVYIFRQNPYALEMVICERVGISKSQLYYIKNNYPKFKDLLTNTQDGEVKKSLLLGLRNISKIMGDEAFLRSNPQHYMKAFELLLKHRAARELGFDKAETTNKYFVIEDKTKPIPQYTKEELDDV